MDNTASELGIIFYYNGKIISNVTNQIDVDIPVFSTSSVAKVTIINQINIANENHVDEIY
jgi:hypothetical protein